MTSASSTVVETYRAMHPKSSALYDRARAIIPGGVTHDGRHMKPFPVYVERALGSHTWTTGWATARCSWATVTRRW
jgi:glutamate-1-semialdehyde 2,1-aminomutase